MPYIKTRTNKSISKEQEESIKSRLGTAIGLLGKSEQWLMVDFDSNCNLYFQGDKNRLNAYVEVKLLGTADNDAYSKMTDEICSIINEELKIDKSNIYVSYYPTDVWGWNGSNF